MSFWESGENLMRIISPIFWHGFRNYPHQTDLMAVANPTQTQNPSTVNLTLN